jgi:hypothetical protein
LYYVVYLLSPDDASSYTFINSTLGARIAYERLADRIEWMRRMRGTDVIPLIALETRTMKTRFGKRERPEFTVVDWRVFGGADAPAAALPPPTPSPPTPSPPTPTPVPASNKSKALTTYLVHGFNRQDHNQRVCMLVDEDPACSPHATAARIAGPNFMFHASENVSIPAAEEHKNLLLTEPELYAYIPALNPRKAARVKRRSASEPADPKKSTTKKQSVPGEPVKPVSLKEELDDEIPTTWGAG